MRLSLLFSLIAASSALIEAASITTFARCGNIIAGGSGLWIGGCDFEDPTDPTHSTDSFARAVITVSGTVIEASADASEDRSSSGADATYQAIFNITVMGGVGSGFLSPTGVTFMHENMAGASFSFVGGGGPCFTNNSGPPVCPFTYGQANSYAVELMAGAGDGAQDNFSSVSFDTSLFQFFDSFDNPVNNATFTIVDAALPEPGSVMILLVAGVSWFAARRVLGR